MTKAEVQAEMDRLHRDIRNRWEATFNRHETARQRNERHALTDRWYELRRQLRAS